VNVISKYCTTMGHNPYFRYMLARFISSG